MHFARQVSNHIALNRAGLGFLSLPPIVPRTFGQANRKETEGAPEAGDGGITRNRRRNDD